MKSFQLNNQVYFLKLVKERIPEKKSKADIIAAALCIDVNTVYKRLEGKTPLTLEEAFKLSRIFGVPLETLFAVEPDNKRSYKVFQHTRYIHSLEDFTLYMHDMIENLKQVAAMPGSHMFYAAKDIPIFYFFEDEVMCGFKIWYWLKYVCNIPEFKNTTYNDDIIPSKIVNDVYAAYREYCMINVTEIWNENSSYAILSQIYETAEAKLVKKPLAIELVRIFEAMIQRVKEEAAQGSRLAHPSKYDLYYNKTLVMDNSLLIHVNELKLQYVPHTGIHYLKTTDYEMVKEYETWYMNQMQKSDLISRGSEKQREALFSQMKDRAEMLKKKIDSL